MTIKLLSQDVLLFVLISIIFRVYKLIPFQIMRKIERQMNEAILNRKDFFSSNTSVEN